MRTRIKIEDLSEDQAAWLATALPGYFPGLIDDVMMTVEFEAVGNLVGTRTMPPRAFVTLINALGAVDKYGPASMDTLETVKTGWPYERYGPAPVPTDNMQPPPCAGHRQSQLGCHGCSVRRAAFYTEMGLIPPHLAGSWTAAEDEIKDGESYTPYDPERELLDGISEFPSLERPDGC